MAACGPWIFLPQSPQLIAVLAGLNRSQAAHQIKNVLGRELAVLLPFQACGLERSLGVVHERVSMCTEAMGMIQIA